MEEIDEAEIKREKKMARMEQGKTQSFDDLVALGVKRGYKNPTFWAKKVYKGRKRWTTDQKHSYFIHQPQRMMI